MISISSRACLTLSGVNPVTVIVLRLVLSFSSGSSMSTLTSYSSLIRLTFSPFLPMMRPTKPLSTVKISWCCGSIWFPFWERCSMSLSRWILNLCIVFWYLKWISTKSFSPKSTARSSPTKDTEAQKPGATLGGPFESGLSCMHVAMRRLLLIMTSFKQPRISCVKIHSRRSSSTGMSLHTREAGSMGGSVLTLRTPPPSRSTMISAAPLEGPSRVTK
mmetsp:Transcript_87829/g.204426  ORF Transcript_87829/g.204426 Transcript_87829/m.204426 type:complete len:218 (-) Transcript_87829:413-1066(-)